LTFADVRALRESWRRHPPAHWLIAAFIGYKPPRDPGAAKAAATQWLP
jgi:hypothetical protein